MLKYSLLLSALILFEAKCTSTLIDYFVNMYSKIKIKYSITVGFLAILGIFQLCVYPIVYFRLFSYYLMIFLVILFIAIPLAVLIIKPKIQFTKEDLFSLAFISIICVLYTYKSFQYTIGETGFDSVHYLSMVIENMSSSTIGGIDYYSGAVIDSIGKGYDYQGFFHFFSMLLKFIQSFVTIPNEAAVSFYLWTSSFLYYFCIVESLLSITRYFMPNKNMFYRLVTILFALIFFTNYFNITLAFFGNTWRSLATGILLLSIYQQIENNDNVLFVPILFACSALISVSSSGLFIGGFIFIAYFFYGVFQHKSSDFFLGVMLSVFPLILYTALFIESLYSIILLALYVLLVLFLLSVKRCFSCYWSSVLILGKLVFIIMLVGILALSFYYHRNGLESAPYNHGLYTYWYYFYHLSALDMTMDLFRFTDFNSIFRNIVLYICIICSVVQIKKNKNYKLFLFLIFLLFLNPFVEPFAMRHLTDFVYARAFDIIMNPFILIFLFGQLLECIEKYSFAIKVIPCLFLGLSCYSLYLNYSTYYTDTFKVSSDFMPTYKTNYNSYQLYQYINENISNNENRPILVSQDYALKGYVNGIQLLFDLADMREAPLYENVDYLAPDEVINYFFPRDYPNQPIWKNDPDYEQGCRIAKDYQIDYIILRNNSTIYENKNYIFLGDKLNGCTAIIYTNDLYSILKVMK